MGRVQSLTPDEIVFRTESRTIPFHRATGGDYEAVDQVFALWSQAERYPDWFDLSLERRTLTDGPMQVGSRYTAVDRMPPGVC